MCTLDISTLSNAKKIDVILLPLCFFNCKGNRRKKLFNFVFMINLIFKYGIIPITCFSYKKRNYIYFIYWSDPILKMYKNRPFLNKISFGVSLNYPWWKQK